MQLSICPRVCLNKCTHTQFVVGVRIRIITMKVNGYCLHLNYTEFKGRHITAAQQIWVEHIYNGLIQ